MNILAFILSMALAAPSQQTLLGAKTAPAGGPSATAAPSERGRLQPGGSPGHVPGKPEDPLADRPVMNRTLTLDEAVAVALRESPAVRGSAEEVEAAVGRLQAARAQRRPQLSTTSFATGGSEPDIYSTTAPVQPVYLFPVPRGGFFDQSATLMLPLYTGGRLRALARQAAAARVSAVADLEGVRQETALMTRMAYQEVLARRAAIEVARVLVTESQERLRVDQTRFQAGAIPEFYLRRDEAEVANAQQQLTNAQRDAALSLVQLETVMGVNPDSQIDTAGSLGFEPASAFIERLVGKGLATEDTEHTEAGRDNETEAKTRITSQRLDRPLPPAPFSVSSVSSVANPSADAAGQAPLVERYAGRLRGLAERQRPELHAARLHVEEAEQGVTVARSAYRPQVGVGATADWMTGTHTDTLGATSFGLTASLPLFDAGLRRANLRTSEADQRHRQHDYERMALEVGQQVTNALLSLGAAEQNVTTAQAGARAAEEEYQAALQRYQAGRSILIEALDALASRTRAETNVIQALYEYNVAQDQLRRAVGQPEAPAPP